MVNSKLGALFAGLAQGQENPFLDKDREARIRLYAERVEKDLSPFTGEVPPPEKRPEDLWRELKATSRLAELPCHDDLEEEFDDDVESATTNALMQCEHYPVDALDLSIRARRALVELRVHTIGDLGTYTQAELAKAFGKLSVNEVLDRLRERGIVLAPR